MPTDFELAFAQARKQGLSQFSFNGKLYTTQLNGLPNKLLQLPLTNNVKKEMNNDPSLKYVNQYNTGLNPTEFDEFKKWAKDRYGDQDKILYEMGAYDLQGAWKAIKNKEIDFDPDNGHLPDTYKKPNHITFSDESRYHNDKNVGGKWGKDNNGKWNFNPSLQTINLYGIPEMQRYFKTYEKDVDLNYAGEGQDKPK